MAGLDLQLNLGGGYSDSDIYVEHGDFAIRNGKFNLVAEEDVGRQVGQRLHVRLLLHRGEVFFNTAAGFPYTEISKFKQSTGIFDSYMKSYIMNTDGVTKLQSYSANLDNGNRVNSVRFAVTVTNGQTIETQQEFNV